MNESSLLIKEIIKYLKDLYDGWDLVDLLIYEKKNNID
tara:strand:+ start:350 stop:463 length:114 start_codon:yes stop_codon:yes gene_type:complete